MNHQVRDRSERRGHSMQARRFIRSALTVSLTATLGILENPLRADPPSGSIRLARSIDGRRFADLGIDSLPSGESPDLDVDPDGRLLLLVHLRPRDAATAPATCVVTKSTDRGKTWSQPRPVSIRTAAGRPLAFAQADLIRTPSGKLRLLALAPPAPSRDADRREGQQLSRAGSASSGSPIYFAASTDGETFHAGRRPVWQPDEPQPMRIAAATFAGKMHLYAYADSTTPRRRSGERRLEHRVSRDGKRFVSVQPSRLPDDVAVGSIVEEREGARMFVTVGDAVRSYISRDGREWREEQGVRMSAALSPSVVKLRDGTYLMAYVAARGDRNEPSSPETIAMAGVWNPSATPNAGEPEGGEPALVVASSDPAPEEVEPSADADGPEVAPSEPTAEGMGASRVGENIGPGAGLTETRRRETADALFEVVNRPGGEGAEEEITPDDNNADDYGFAPRPDEKPDVDYNEWYQTQVPTAETDNAAPDYEEIANDPRLKKPEEGETPVFVDMFNSDHSGTPVPWDETDHPEWAESSKRVQDLIEKFQRASAQSNYAPPVRFGGDTPLLRKPLLIDLVLPDLSAHRTLAKATLADAWKKIDGRVPPRRMMDAWRAVLRGANHFEKRPTLIENLVSIAERRLVMENARWALKRDVLSSQDDLKDALDLLRSLGRDKYDTGVAARGEFAMAAQFTQYLFSPPGPDDKPRLNLQRVDELAPAFDDWFDTEGADVHERLSSMTTADYYATLDAFERVYREMADQLRVGYPDVRASDMDATQLNDLHASPLTELLMPSFSRVLVLRARNETTFRATQLTYAVHLFHSQNGRWPKSINDLASLNNLPREALDEMRTDPFSGRDFGYQLDADGPVIYSVGENAEDDGGVHAPRWGDGEKDENASDDFVFWPPQPPP